MGEHIQKITNEGQTYSSISESRSMKRSLGKAFMLLFAKDLKIVTFGQYNNFYPVEIIFENQWERLIYM